MTGEKDINEQLEEFKKIMIVLENIKVEIEDND